MVKRCNLLLFSATRLDVKLVLGVAGFLALTRLKVYR